MNKTFTPAFPSRRGATAEEISALGLYKGADLVFDGMTLRDYFAAKAMQGYIVGTERPIFHKIAEVAYEMADAMLEARK